ncbi:Dam family site-specific DNA-(adenine-N6)-methyltransferase [Helicobacter saguini]|uniref:Site-specific DNA-methyltransferase (adenine-specific) n=1 Tax=Helicobacter saguini TaxID=1548018 RepID=A0A347VY75_9HELI|nr:Dam family site-specific DNA-(adenine-N6)-methyltransferase [Helicobacter saguini]MWV61326.1 Dam family site-specific DNA-(adenine-N6)-methyltransferase [Helicobacter saguini]MWV68005.1 Dam family site-specific DNA-(adenine-N6)-methyltransferase [Helicobacter saguini]MWV70528.1 Dam family site-specific DNA-(adenine-N6)-methyltransferase [Helicobacter saguini]MWV72431.1 Dam family site-specific DNA-(adenine-N6)-methyltransferase [Helicobacter saguini]TLD94806.1 DNA adenine methylase [Helicob
MSNLALIESNVIESLESNTQKSNLFNIDSKPVQSPLNYIGGKYKLLPQIMPLFPKNINIAIDLFCGGANVGINLNAKKIILNDKMSELMQIFKLFKESKMQHIFMQINKLIESFELSKSQYFGYLYYKCDSSKGLSSFNKNNFLNLRNAYNKNKDALYLFTLIIFSFNNQIRFNAKGEFNLPCGKRDFNANMQEKLKNFMQILQTKNIELQNKDFRNFDISNLDSNDFIYIDPPYFLANASYNENNAWGENDENDLLDFLLNLDSKDIKFALSNVLFHKNKTHKILESFLKKHTKFKIHNLNFNYKNCNYQSKNLESKEVLITNY